MPALTPELSTEFRNRLVTLCNGQPGLRGGLHIEIREPAQAPPAATLEFIASTGAVDRCQEIIMADGWRLDHYRQNPVFQNAHQYGDIIFTLGKALRTEVRGGQLVQLIEFAVDANPMARIAYKLYQGGFLNAVSVGFVPLRWENGDATAEFRRRYLEQELLEVSAVPIPANPEALQLGLKSGALEREDLHDLLDLLHQSAGGKGGQVGGEGVNQGAQFLRLAREIAEVMRGA